VSLRVGVLPFSVGAHVGGGFTFEQEVLAQLLRIAPESAHRFVLLETTPERRGDLPENVSYATPAPSSPLRRVLRRSRTQTVNQIVADADVDVVWSLFPHHPVPDVPFITIVWDLQHRLQPLFPEVSAGGEWDRREDMLSRLLRRAAAVIAGTEAGRREISAFYQVPEQRIHVLPHPTPRFALEAPAGSSAGVVERFGLSPEYLLYPAQFWPHKNHANLLLAMRRLLDGGTRLQLVLVGSDHGGNAAAMRRLASQLGVEQHVRFLGFVQVEDLVALYRGARCLAYASLFGPENLPPLEAFALGCPVVASDVPGAQEQMGDAAVLVDATRPEDLADALRRVHEDAGLRTRLIERGRERALRWTGADFVRGVFRIVDGLEPYVRCWRPIRPS
jgi:glycosyltransferase involved in cell wall biosynthesis